MVNMEQKIFYAGVPVIIGSRGVEKIIELDLTDEEKNNFDKSIKSQLKIFLMLLKK